MEFIGRENSFVDPHQGNEDVMPFSLSTTKAYVEFIGREKARAY